MKPQSAESPTVPAVNGSSESAKSNGETNGHDRHEDEHEDEDADKPVTKKMKPNSPKTESTEMITDTNAPAPTVSSPRF
jgi:hypothetical protein